MDRWVTLRLFNSFMSNSKALPGAVAGLLIVH